MCDDKVVLLGEQSASKTDGVGSNPTDLANGLGTGRLGNRLIRGYRQVRLLPARLQVQSRGAARSARHFDIVEAAGSNPAETTAEWTGVGRQHGLISRTTPVRIRPPQLEFLDAYVCALRDEPEGHGVAPTARRDSIGRQAGASDQGRRFALA